MTYFDQISEAIYNPSIPVSTARIKRQLKEIGLEFPLSIAALNPQRDGSSPAGWQGENFWHPHPGIIYAFWQEEPSDLVAFENTSLLCGEVQHCEAPAAFIHHLQRAILALRRVELSREIPHRPTTLSFEQELETRRLALGQLRQHHVHQSTFAQTLEVWMNIVLLRHQGHLNTVRRKILEFAALLTADIDQSAAVSNGIMRLGREVQGTYSLGELRKNFPMWIDELLQEFPLQIPLRCENLSPIARQALEWMEKNYRKPVALAECAASIPVSDAYLCRLLRQETGLSPVAHLQRKRVAHAKVLLRERRLGIAEIARRSGFGSVEHFYRVFRKHTHISPSKYQKNAHGS